MDADLCFRWSGALLLGFALGVACEEEQSCPEGREGCPCTSDGLCLQGLSCLSSYCVDPDWMPGETAAAEETDPDGEEGGSYDNEAACEALLDDIACGNADLGMYIDCSVYSDQPCDLADYFDCAAERVSCTDGMLDVSRLAECMDLATCA